MPRSTVPPFAAFALSLAPALPAALACSRSPPPAPPLTKAERAALPPEAATALASAVERVLRAPDDPRAWRAYARLADSLVLRSRALEAWKRLARLRPEAPAVHYHLARNLHELGREEEALASLEKVLHLVPGDPAALRRKARWLLALGRLDEAASAARRALARDPDDAEAALLLARIDLARGEDGRAVERLGRLAASGRGDGRVARLLAQALARVGRREEAEAWAARAGPSRPLSPDPWMDEIRAVRTGPQARYARAMAALRRKGPRAALPELRALYEEHPDVPGLLEALTRAEADVGESERARRRLEERLARRPQDHRALLLLAELAERAGRTEEAVELLERAHASQPDSIDALLGAARAALLGGDPGRSRELLERAERLAPADPRIRDLAARLPDSGGGS